MPSAKRSRPKCRYTLTVNPVQTRERPGQPTKKIGTRPAGPLKSLPNSCSYIMCEMPACDEAEGKQGDGTRMIIGYARVSTDSQSLEGQDAALKAAGASCVFAEKISGAVTDRKALSKAIAALQTGDVLLVTRLDRLARSTRDLLNVLATISDRGAAFR